VADTAVFEAMKMKQMQPPDGYILSVFRNWLEVRCEDVKTTPWDPALSHDLMLLSRETVLPTSLIHTFLYKGQEILSSIYRFLVNSITFQRLIT